MKDLDNLISTLAHFPAWPFTLLAAIISVSVPVYIWQRNAAATFRAAIDPEIANRFDGHALHAALLGSLAGNGRQIEGAYYKHRRAFHEYRRYLGPIGRHRINRAWNEYTGGNEECPDFLVKYCLSPAKIKLLKNRLEALRNI